MKVIGDDDGVVDEKDDDVVVVVLLVAVLVVPQDGSFLLADDDLAAGAHVLSRLGGTLVLAGLEADDGLASLELLLGEVALGLVGGLGSQLGSGPLGVPVGLTAQGEEAVDD